MSDSSQDFTKSDTNLHTIDRRVWFRYPSRRTAFCKSTEKENEEFCLAQACDISRGGLKLLLAHKFERGTILKIRTVNEGPDKLALMMAEVRYAMPTLEGKWMMGCAFLKELSEIELQAWMSDGSLKDEA
jgi:hypothetical protein